MIALIVGAPIMVMAIVVGLITSIMQAVTQLQDQTLGFVPKIVAMMLTMLYVLPWAMSQMIEYSASLFKDISNNL